MLYGKLNIRRSIFEWYIRAFTQFMNSLWITKSSIKVFENPWIVLHDEQVINPCGGEREYGRIHFKHAAMGIIPLDKDLNTYLVSQWCYHLNAYSWEIPMG